MGRVRRKIFFSTLHSFSSIQWYNLPCKPWSQSSRDVVFSDHSPPGLGWREGGYQFGYRVRSGSREYGHQEVREGPLTQVGTVRIIWKDFSTSFISYAIIWVTYCRDHTRFCYLTGEDSWLATQSLGSLASWRLWATRILLSQILGWGAEKFY